MQSTKPFAEQCATTKPVVSSNSRSKKSNPFSKAVHKKVVPVPCDEPAQAANTDGQDAANRKTAVKNGSFSEADQVPIVAAEPTPVVAPIAAPLVVAEPLAVSPNVGAVAALPEPVAALWTPAASGIGGLAAGIGGIIAAAAAAGGGSAAAIPLIATAPAPVTVVTPDPVAPTPAPAPTPTAPTPLPVVAAPIPVVATPAPAQPKSITAGGALSSESDSGTAGDNVTNNARPLLKGVATANTNVTVSLDTNGDGIADMVLNTVSDAQGNWSVTPTTRLPDGAISGSVVADDGQGNKSPASVLTFTVDTVAQTPTVTIVADTNNDGILQGSEQSVSSTMSLKIGVPAGANAGDVITLTNASNGGSQTSFTLTAADIANGFITTTAAKPPAGAELQVSVVLSDLAGNTSARSSDNVLVKTFVPGVTMFVKSDTNNDGVIDGTERYARYGTQVLSVNLDNTKPGDVLLIWQNGVPVSYTEITAAQIAAHDLEINVVANEGTSANYSAVIMDSAGNTSAPARDSALQDEFANDKNVRVTIVADTNNNGALSSSEVSTSATTLAIKIALPADAVAGHSVVITDGTTAQSPVVLTAQQIADGYFIATIAKPAQGQSVSVSAHYVDGSGTSGPESNDFALVGDEKPIITLVVASDINNDGVQNTVDAVPASDWKLSVNTSSLHLGDVFFIFANGERIGAAIVDATFLANPTFDVSLGGMQEGTKYNFSAVAINALGVSSDVATDTILLDMIAGPTSPAILIVPDTNNDGYLNAAEIGNATTIAIKITVPGDAHVGDVLTFNNGTSDTVYTLTAAQIASGFIDATVARPAEDSSLTVSATLKDASGLISDVFTDTVELNAVIDPALVSKAAQLSVVIVSDVNNNAIIAASEQNAQGEFTFHIQLYAGAQRGEQVWYNFNGAEYNAQLDDRWVNQGYIDATLLIPEVGTNIAITAYLKDAQDNRTYGGSDSAVVGPYVADLNSFSISSDTDNDGYLVPSEYGTSTTVSLHIDLANATKVGDVLVLEDGAGGSRNITITRAMLDAHGLDTTWALPAIDTDLNLMAHMKNAAGLVSPTLFDSVFYSSTDVTSSSAL